MKKMNQAQKKLTRKKRKEMSAESYPVDSHMSIKAWTGAGIVSLAVLFASNAPEGWRVWGFDGLSDLSSVMQIGWIMGALVLALLVAVSLRRWADDRESRLFVPVVGLMFLMVAVLIPAVTFLRGDGQLLINTLERGEIIYKRTLFYNSLMMTLGKQFGMTPQSAFRLVDAVAALIYILALLKFSRRFRTLSSRTFVMIAGIFTGSFPILAGLVEYYPMTHALLLLSLVLSVDDIEKGKFPLFGFLACLIAAGFHYKAVVILPAFAFAIRPIIGKRWAFISFIFLSVGGFTAALFVARVNLLFPLGPMPNDGYTIYSLRHLLDLVNLAFWAVPVLLAVAILVGRVVLIRKGIDPVDSFLLAALLGALVFVFFFSPDLGMARDADLLCLFVIPATIWVLRRFQKSNLTVSPGFVGAALFIGIVTVGAQVFLQNNEGRAVARHIRQLKLDPARSGYGWEVLSVKYRDRGDTDAEFSALQEAVKYSPNGRYYLRMAQIETQRNRLKEAEPYARIAVEKLPEEFVAQGLYGYILFTQNRFDEAAKALSQAILHRSVDSNHYSMLAYIYLQKGEIEEAKNILTLGLKQAKKHNEQFYCIFGMVEEQLGNKDYASMHYNRAARLNPGSYWGQQAAARLKNVQSELGDGE